MNLNKAIEEAIPIINCILGNVEIYTGYNLKYGYFDSAYFDDGSYKLKIYNHNGVRITTWDLLDAIDRADLMTRNFIWYDIVPRENVVNKLQWGVDCSLPRCKLTY